MTFLMPQILCRHNSIINNRIIHAPDFPKFFEKGVQFLEPRYSPEPFPQPLTQGEKPAK